MKKVQAVGFRQYGSAEVLERLERPYPELKDDTVLIRVAAAGINPADWSIRKGQFKLFMGSALPFVPGADVAGVVEAVGASVTRFGPGDAVFAMLPISDGGGYAEVAAVAEKNVARMPQGATFAEAAAAPLAGLTALQALRDKAKLEPGARVLINGASGGVGTYAVQIAKALGAASLTAVCSARNIELVRGLGADEVVDYTKTDLSELGTRFDVVFDTVNKLSFRKGCRLLRKGGVMVTVNPVLDKLAPDFLAPLWGGRRLRSLLVKPSGEDLEVLGRWLSEGKVRSVIDQTYPLEKAADAHRYSETERASGKLVLIVAEGLANSRLKIPALQSADEIEAPGELS